MDSPPPFIYTAATRPPGQPEPILTLALSMEVAGNHVTAIHRRWRPGRASRCQLCDRCNAEQDECLIMLHGRFTAGQAKFLSTRGMRHQDHDNDDDAEAAAGSSSVPCARPSVALNSGEAIASSQSASSDIADPPDPSAGSSLDFFRRVMGEAD